MQSLDTWWHGYSWLRKLEVCSQSGALAAAKSLPEERKGNPQHVISSTSASLIDVSRFSSSWKLIRNTACVHRFLQSVRRRDNSAGELTATELEATRMYWVPVVQKEFFARFTQTMLRHSRQETWNLPRFGTSSPVVWPTSSLTLQQ